jgi:hypothetical protein
VLCRMRLGQKVCRGIRDMFVEGVDVISLLFGNQYFVLVECLHIEGFPSIHTFALMT